MEEYMSRERPFTDGLAAQVQAVTTAVASAPPAEEKPTCPKLGLTYV